MLVTELEAKEMVCPLPRHESTGNGCYGSRCMWFRWQDAAFQDRDYTSGAPPSDDEIQWMEREGFVPIDKAQKYWRRSQPNRRGFCGMAGKP